MEFHFIDIAIIIGFFAITLAIGLLQKNKASKDIENFFLGGRKFPWWLAGISMVATTFAADTPLAVTELIAQGGVAANWLWWNMLTGGILTTIFFAKNWRRAEVLTDLEFIEIRYSGKAASFLRGMRSLYFGLFMNSLVIAWVNLALLSLLKVFFPEYSDFTHYFVILVLMLLTFSYSGLSGIWGVAITDALQFTIAMLGCIALAVIVVSSPEIGGIAGLKAKLSAESFNFFPVVHESSSTNVLHLSLGSFIAFIFFQWWSSWYPGNEPGGGGYIAQRMMSTKDENQAMTSTLFFQIMHYCIRPWPWVIVGLCALVLYPDLAPEDKKLGFVMAMKDFLPVGLRGLLFVSFLAAYMSTISTQLNLGASYLTNDFYMKFINANCDSKSLIRISRINTFIIMLVGFLVTFKVSTISGVWTFMIECGAGLGFVLILRWYWWKINAWTEIIATIVPFVAKGFTQFVLGANDATWRQGVLENPKSFFFVLFSTVIISLVSILITPDTKKETLEKFFTKIKPLGFWGPLGKTDNKELIRLFFQWIILVVLSYSLLFTIGSLVLQEWSLFYGSIGISIASLLILKFANFKLWDHQYN
ncbi:MAG: Na+:solute symporter [Halobacteriovoraceae bacterium]|nr:Na+:solute symporter [Halobacteriovoraceae bacterium]